MFYLRQFKLGDEQEIYKLFYETMHSINSKDYTPEQINVFAPKDPNLDEWRKTLSENFTVVAVDKDNGIIIGFADLTVDGELFRGYVHKDYQGQGIGKALLEARENYAKKLGLKELVAEVSITAKSFFEKHGYRVENEQHLERKGVAYVNYLMRKTL